MGFSVVWENQKPMQRPHRTKAEQGPPPAVLMPVKIKRSNLLGVNTIPKKPTPSGVDFFLVDLKGFVCIFVFDENRGCNQCLHWLQ